MAKTFAVKGVTQFEEYVERKVVMKKPQLTFRRLNIFERIISLLGIYDKFC